MQVAPVRYIIINLKVKVWTNWRVHLAELGVHLRNSRIHVNESSKNKKYQQETTAAQTRPRTKTAEKIKTPQTEDHSSLNTIIFKFYAYSREPPTCCLSLSCWLYSY